ncbi:MAG: hypothetical protein ACPGQL_06610 [Thermoplasmatota archaeon]
MSLAERRTALLDGLAGTRGLAVALPTLVAISWLQGFLPNDFDVTLLTVPLALLVAWALLSVPREGARALVAARAEGLMAAFDASRLRRDLVAPGLLVVLLLPRLFLGFYGIPHMSPLAGLVLASITRRVAALAIVLVVWAAAATLRRHAKRTDVATPSLRRRDAQVIAVWGLVLVWLVLLHPFWAPFGPLGWPPAFTDLGRIDALLRVTMSVAVPVLLFPVLVVHAERVKQLIRRRAAGEALPGVGLLSLFGLQVLLALGAVALHTYVLLWIANYHAATGF